MQAAASPAHASHINSGSPNSSGAVEIHTGGRFTIWADLLPAEAAAKLRTLREERDEANLLARDAAEKRNEIVNLKINASHMLSRVEADLDRAYPPVEDKTARPEWQDAKARVDRLVSELDRLDTRAETLNAKWNNAASLVGNCEKYLRTLDGPARPHKGAALKIKKGENVAALIESTRADIAALRARIE